MGRKQKSVLPIFAPNTLPILPGVPACMVREECAEVNARVAAKFGCVRVSESGWSHKANRTVAENATVGNSDKHALRAPLMRANNGADSEGLVRVRHASKNAANRKNKKPRQMADRGHSAGEGRQVVQVDRENVNVK